MIKIGTTFINMDLVRKIEIRFNSKQEQWQVEFIFTDDQPKRDSIRNPEYFDTFEEAEAFVEKTFPLSVLDK